MSSSPAISRLNKTALWLAMILLTLQLISCGIHKHALTEQSQDCVSCYLAAHMPTTTPAAVAVMAVALALLAYSIAMLPIYRFIAVQTRLVPPSQAPPRR